MANFMTNMKGTLDNRKQLTENGAVGYSTSGHELLDMNFAIGSLRHESDRQIQDRFAKAYYENPLLAIKFLFKVRDCRGGDGERRTFRVCIDWLIQNKPDVVKAILVLIPEYGRWDDLLRLVDTKLKSDVAQIAEMQYASDLIGVKNKTNSISLIGKWSFSCNCSNKERKRLAKLLIKELHITEPEYRKMLSTLRGYLKIVERDMCKKEWSNIKYEAVPSRANLIYNSAFLRNDEARRRKYLESLQKGEAKINASVLFPHDIVNKYGNGYRGLKALDSALEAMWKALPDYVNGNGNTLVVGDGSGSMYTEIDPHSNVYAVDVADALAIYFAEHMTGQFANKYITFGGSPHLVDFSNCKTLRDKITLARKNNDCNNTDLYKVFRLILDTAVRNHMSQEEMPQNVLIISDNEYDRMCCFEGYYGSHTRRNSSTLFDGIAAEYSLHGYHLPRLVFWNVNSRTNTIPVQQNPAGVALVSGFSPATCKMVLSNKTDPYDVLLETLNSERYQKVEDALKGVEL